MDGFSPNYGNFIGLDPSPCTGTHQLAYHHDNILPKSGFSKSSSTSPPEHFSCHVLRSKNGTTWGLSETSWDKMGQAINQMMFKGKMTCSVDRYTDPQQIFGSYIDHLILSSANQLLITANQEQMKTKNV